MPPTTDAPQQAERLIAWAHNAILTTLADGVSGEVDTAGALRLPALAFEALSDGVVIYTDDRRIAHLNAAAGRILQLDDAPDSVAVTAPAEGPWRYDGCDRQRRQFHLAERVLRPLLQRMTPTGVRAREIRITTAAGREALLDGYVRPIHDAEGRMVGSVVVIREVTEQEQLERATASWARRLRAAFDAITDTVIVFDGGERTVALNPGAHQLLEFEEAARPLASARPPLTALRQGSHPARVATRAPARRILEGEGDMDAAGPDAPTRDALERGQREQRAHQAATRWDAEFFAEAMHELRNVTASLCGFVDLLNASTMPGKQSKLTKARVETIEEIEHAAACLAELTNHIEDVVRLRTERFAIHCQVVDLVALVQRVAKRLQVTTHRHAIAVSTTAVSVMAQIDVRRIEQVLTNLIGNAIKYSPDGGEIMVKVSEDQGRGRHFVAVLDHGIGIPRHQHGRVFQRFGRADNARELGVAGTGLGLYLCRKIVERHGGQIGFRSRAGRGTAFYMSLPVGGAAREMRAPG